MKNWISFRTLPQEGDEIYILISDCIKHRIIPAKVINGVIEYQCEIPDDYPKKFFFYSWSLKNESVSEQDLGKEAELAIIEHEKVTYEALMTRLRAAALTPPA